VQNSFVKQKGEKFELKPDFLGTSWALWTPDMHLFKILAK
jgi:hypothetical protein